MFLNLTIKIIKEHNLYIIKEHNLYNSFLERERERIGCHAYDQK